MYDLIIIGGGPAGASAAVFAGRAGLSTLVIDADAEGRTNVDHVWAAGTAGGVSVHTIVTAGDGARVAINIVTEQRGERHVDHDVMPKPTD